MICPDCSGQMIPVVMGNGVEQCKVCNRMRFEDMTLFVPEPKVSKRKERPMPSVVGGEKL